MADVEQRLLLFEFIGHVHQDFLRLRAEIGCSESQLICTALLRSDIEVADAAGLHHTAVGKQLPLHFVGIQPDEEIFVIDLDPALRKVDRRSPNALVLALHLVGMGVPRAVGGDDTVAVERVVRRIVVVEITTVEERHTAVGLVAGKPLVDEVPDETALIGGIFAYQFPIVVEAAQRIPHGMGIFTLNERFGGVVASIFLALFIAPVHGADDVGEGPVPVVHGTFVMHRTRRVVLLDPTVAGLEVGAHARLVAHRPDDDRRMVLVAQHHAPVALHVRLCISRHLGQRVFVVAHAVRLDVGLVHDIDAVAVAQLVPLRVVGIVARAYGVDIHLFHDADVLDHPFAAYHIAADGIHLVAVGALDQHGLPVHEQLCVPDLHGTEAHGLRHGLGHAPAVRHGDLERIEVRGLGRPFGRVGDLEDIPALAAGRLQPMFRHDTARRIAQRQADRLHTGRGFHLDAQRGVLIFRIQHGRDAHILEVRLVAGSQLHAAGNAREAPEVLVFEVGAVRPAEHLQGDEVFARLHELRDVELRGQLAVLAVTDETSVDPDIDVRRSGTDRKMDVLAAPRCRDVERAAVGTHMVLGIGHIGRIVPEITAPGIADIHIDGVAVTVQLPHPRHGHAAPRRIVVVDGPDAGRTLRSVAYPVEFPYAVERQALARGERRAHRQAVDFIDGRILPFTPGLGAGSQHARKRCRKDQKSFFHHGVIV